MTYQDAVEIGKIITAMGPPIILIGICIGAYLALRKHNRL